MSEVVNPSTGKKPKSKVRKALEWVVTIVFGGLFAFLAVGQIIGMTQRSNNYGQTLTYGRGAFVIQTDSMEPEYKVKTAIITNKVSPQTIVNKFNSGKKVDITFYCAYVSNNAKYDYPLYRPGDITYGGIEYKIAGNEPTYPNPEITQIITHRLIDIHIEESRDVGKGKYTFVVAGINTGGTLSEIGQYQLLTENELLGIVELNSPVLGGVFRFITTPWGLLVFLLVPALYLVFTSVIDIFKAIKEPDEEEGSSGDGSSNSGSGSPLDGLSEEDKERLKKQMLDDLLNKKGGK